MFNYKYMNNMCNNGMCKANIYEDKCDNVTNYDICEDECMCGFDEYDMYNFPTNPMFGQAYVPMQRLTNTFTPCVGLKMGTLFPEMYSNYIPCQSLMENNMIREMNQIGEGCNK